MSRRWLVTVSIAAHVAVATAFVIAGVWRIERLDADNRFTGAVAVMLPIPAASGGPVAADPPKVPPKKPPPRVTHDRVQPTERPTETPTVVATGGGGSGSAEGPGTGTGTDTTGTCTDPAGCGAVAVAAVCGNGVLEVNEACDDGNRANGDGCSDHCSVEEKKVAQFVPPTLLKSLFLSGDREVHPSDTVKTAILREGRDRVTGTLKVCVGEGGDVASVGVVSSTRYAEYDSALVSAVHGWRYRPYSLGGKAIAVCGMVTFIYAIK